MIVVDGAVCIGGNGVVVGANVVARAVIDNVVTVNIRRYQRRG